MSADPQSAAEAWNPGQVELTVQMDVGSAPLTLDALQSLQAGYVFELETPAATPVSTAPVATDRRTAAWSPAPNA